MNTVLEQLLALRDQRNEAQAELERYLLEHHPIDTEEKNLGAAMRACSVTDIDEQMRLLPLRPLTRPNVPIQACQSRSLRYDQTLTSTNPVLWIQTQGGNGLTEHTPPAAIRRPLPDIAMETLRESSRRLARAAAASWTEIDGYLSSDPDLSAADAKERMFQLESVAEQAHNDYFENVDADGAWGSNE
ncbi:hypothetical protein IB234_20650 [Pseudomonas sp. PDM16]|uniref:hypothetical protein n=1 Tax=Pseudomonas sp. PDM16 TaxID=2769292 RepID=UPI00177C4154|nr:hypothetical protein [Pseudomonas sp. PDM16]MBD9416982.1 hypothetical protein [Pseudomonas sp. PDM16]